MLNLESKWQPNSPTGPPPIRAVVVLRIVEYNVCPKLTTLQCHIIILVIFNIQSTENHR